MFQVYRRYLRYRAFYPARCPPESRPSPSRKLARATLCVIPLLLLLWHWTGASVFIWSAAALTTLVLGYITYPERR
jgi:hypothetical protein